MEKIGKYEEAEQDFLEALNQEPNNINVIQHLGSVREKLGGDKLQMALNNFNK